MLTRIIPSKRTVHKRPLIVIQSNRIILALVLKEILVLGMTTSAQNQIIRYAKIEVTRKWGPVYTFRGGTTSTLKVSRILARTNCYSISISIRALKADKWREQPDLIDGFNLIPILPLRLTTLKCTETKSFVLFSNGPYVRRTQTDRTPHNKGQIHLDDWYVAASQTAEEAFF